MSNPKINQDLVLSYRENMKRRIQNATFALNKRTEEVLLVSKGYPCVYVKALIKNLKEHKETGLASMLQDELKQIG